MDNIFYNASHTDAAPAKAFQRPKHAFKGIDHDSTPEALIDRIDPSNRPEPKKLLQLPAPPPLHLSSPNQARQRLGLPTLPRLSDSYPRLLSDVQAETQSVAPECAASAEDTHEKAQAS